MKNVTASNIHLSVSRPGALLLAWNDLNPSWKCNHVPSKVWDSTTYLIPNFDGATAASLGRDK